ncbi:glutathione S-transferase 1 [Drosophila guanche]|uniref:Blast:Glutathione S-transferase 1 n=1 Tax=Drosophila guanche TaxID=7266 RepID=A0A3B0JMB4_DROGU|nr:glutathione S-transferase 1 [Drosophila guanche]XP_034128251.1 glutathione S-transferase 1 [Drosophila guanche]XP_034128259.1 glutathione S-transferase 1 [Drosophila guanche]SPP74426.1 blast:Glutathione S-transferase 1 [Drosophila guanche]
MSKPILYYALFSPPARACMITAKLIGLDLELKLVDFTKKEHCGEEFLKLNPQHQVPVFVDTDGEVYVDSHAIICFMVGKYAKDDQLYPKDLKRRAHIDHRLHYENGVLFQVIKDIVARNIYGGEGDLNQRSLTLCHNAYADLEHFLLKGNFVVGNELSVADVSIHTTLVTLELLIPPDPDRYPHIAAWLERMHSLIPDNEEINLKGAEALNARIRSCMAANKLK